MADDLHGEIWEFVALSSGGIVLDKWMELARESRRHKHKVVSRWSRLDRRSNTAARPSVPSGIVARALSEFRAGINLHPGEPEAAAQQQET